MRTIVITICLCLVWLAEGAVSGSAHYQGSDDTDRGRSEDFEVDERLLNADEDGEVSVRYIDQYNSEQADLDDMLEPESHSSWPMMDQDPQAGHNESEPAENYQPSLAFEQPNYNSFSCRGATCNFRSSCGLAPLNSRSRTMRRSSTSEIPYIVNGEPQIYGEWPSFAKITATIGPLISTCGGVLISDQHILTAGHCVLANLGFSLARIDPRNIRVIMGEHSVNQWDSYEKFYLVSSVCLARRYSADPGGSNVIHDFAILTLTSPVVFSHYTQPACLPYEPIDSAQAECYLVGAGAISRAWGREVSADRVYKMRVQPASCALYGFGHLDESRVCYTKYGGYGDSCSGDSGGPILCLNPQTRRWTVVATVSFGSQNCDGTTLLGWIGVYARITNLLPTIKADCGI